MSSAPPSGGPADSTAPTPNPVRDAQRTDTAGWLDAKERGGVFVIRLTVFLTTFLGRRFGRFVGRFVALYYTLTSPKARRAIRLFHRRLEQREISAGEVYRHLLRFVHATLDAFFFVSGRSSAIPVTRTGEAYLTELREQRRGAILLGAHLGSFYAMRGQSARERLPLHALVYTRNARMLNDALAKLDPDGTAHLLELDPEGGLESMLRVREILERGELVAILGDRLPANVGDDRIVHAPFLGADAPFPAGPFLLAAMLKCPVYLTFGLCRASGGYDLFCEPFAERIELPRGDRPAALARYVAQYAARLEHYARNNPENWFNFYDFWASPKRATPEPSKRPR